MPIVLRERGFRFGFFALDIGEPPHVHVEVNDHQAKFWLDPVEFEWSHGMKQHELNEARRIIEANLQFLLRSWHEFFPNS